MPGVEAVEDAAAQDPGREVSHAQLARERRIIGTKVQRLDGPLKVSGKAKYSYDRNLPGLLHAKILRSPHAHAKIVEIDLGPRGAHAGRRRPSHVHKGPGSELFYAGDEIAAVAAETEEQARDALRAIKVKYEVLPHVASEEQGLADGGRRPSRRRSCSRRGRRRRGA